MERAQEASRPSCSLTIHAWSIEPGRLPRTLRISSLEQLRCPRCEPSARGSRVESLELVHQGLRHLADFVFREARGDVLRTIPVEPFDAEDEQCARCSVAGDASERLGIVGASRSFACARTFSLARFGSRRRSALTRSSPADVPHRDVLLIPAEVRESQRALVEDTDEPLRASPVLMHGASRTRRGSPYRSCRAPRGRRSRLHPTCPPSTLHAGVRPATSHALLRCFDCRRERDPRETSHDEEDDHSDPEDNGLEVVSLFA